MAKPGNVTIKDAQLLFRNFAGREGMYNAEGDRNFCVVLPKDLASEMHADGWNIKFLKPQDDDEEYGDPYVQVSVKFKGRPPKLTLINSRGRVPISEDECEIFDYIDIKTADLIINPYEWAVNGKSGIKAYLKNLFITVDEDELDHKYSDVPYADEEPSLDDVMDDN